MMSMGVLRPGASAPADLARRVFGPRSPAAVAAPVTDRRNERRFPARGAFALGSPPGRQGFDPSGIALLLGLGLTETRRGPVVGRSSAGVSTTGRSGAAPDRVPRRSRRSR